MFGASKFKNAQGVEAKKELHYPDLTPSVGSDGQTIAASAEYIVVADQTTNGGSLNVLTHANFGKRKDRLAILSAHSKQIWDMSFSPFNPRLLATCSEDGSARTFLLSDAASIEPRSSMANHKRTVSSLRWHPTADGVIVTGGMDNVAKIWDVETSTDRLTLEGATGGVHSVSWSYDGGLVVTTSADKSIRLHDSRSGAVVATVLGHEGVKPSRLTWAGPGDRFVSSGFAKSRDREFCAWDARALSKPIFRNNLDASTGVLTPFFDPDTQLLFISGKGDSTVRVFELKAGAPFFTNHSIVAGPDPIRAMCMLPKTAVDCMQGEITRLYKLTNNSVVPISFKVPRKSYRDFHDDIFPLTLADSPTLSAKSFFEDEVHAPAPKLMSLNPALRGSSSAVSSSSSSSASSSSSPAASSSSPASSSSSSSTSSSSSSSSSYSPSPAASSSRAASSTPVQRPDNPWAKPVVEEKVEVYKPKVPVNIVRKTHFRHLEAKIGMRRDHYENIQAEYGVESPLQASTQYLAFPRAGAGGRITILPIAQVGKLVDDYGCLEVGHPVTCFEFSPFHPDVLATGDENGGVKIWKLPADLLSRKGNNLREAQLVLRSHQARISSVSWNPTAANIVASTAVDGSLRVHDAETGSLAYEHKGLLGELVQSIKWNYDGSLLAVITRDHRLKVIDPRAGVVVSEGPSHQGAKGERLCWVGNTGLILSVGFSKSAHRELCLWRSNDVAAGALASFELDAASGTSQPYYDEGTGVAWLCGKGDGTIFYWEITPNEPPYAHYLSSHITAEPLADVAFLPKRVCNPKIVEIARLFKLCPNIKTIQPISMLVPRQRKEFFQDDLYPDCPGPEPALQAAEWLAGATAPPRLVSMAPPDMTRLSDAPPVEIVKKYTFDPRAPVKEVDAKEAVLGDYYKKMSSFKEQEPEQQQNSDDDAEWDE